MLTPGNICHDFVLAEKMICKVHINDVHGIIVGIGCAKEQGTERKKKCQFPTTTSKTSKTSKTKGGFENLRVNNET
jgi:hypothetical protein